MRALRAYTQPRIPTPDAGDQRRQLVERYAPMVKRVARRIWRRLPSGQSGLEQDDLISAGIVGLLEAEKRYDATCGRPFETFAEFRVKGAMLDELRRRDPFPRRLRVKANKLKSVEEKLRNRLGRAGSDDEVAAELGLEPAELQKLRSDVEPCRFVDSEDPGLHLEDASPSPHRTTADREMRETLIELLDTLPEREKLVLDLYFNRELKLSEIGEILEVTVGRVSQLKTSALARLKKRMNRLN